MATSTSEKYNRIISAKEQIRQAINKKGVKVAIDVPFEQYGAKIESIPQINSPEEASKLLDSVATYFPNIATGGYQFYTNNSVTTFNKDSLDILKSMGFSNATSLSHTFGSMSNLQYFDSFDFANNAVTTAEYMFAGDPKLQEIKRVYISSPALTSINYMFQNTPQLTKLNLEVNTNAALNCQYVFSQVFSQNLHRDFNIKIQSSNSLSCYYMFSLNNYTTFTDASEVLSNMQLIAPTINLQSMFRECYYMTTVPDNFAGIFQGNVSSMQEMFAYTAILKNSEGVESIQNFFNNVDLSRVTSMQSMFYNSTPYGHFADLNLEIIFPTDTQTCPISSMFSCANSGYSGYSASTITKFSSNTAGSASNLFTEYGNTVADYHSLTYVDTINLPYTAYATAMFSYCSRLTSIGHLNFGDNLKYPCYSGETTSAQSSGGMFYNCIELTSVPAFNVHNAVNVKGMFYGCAKLQSIPALDLSVAGASATYKNYNYNSAGNPYYYMVYGCSNLEFFHCTNIVCSLDLSYSTKFTRAALLEVIDNLVDVGVARTLHIGSTNLSRLTADDIALATDKGWTIN